MFKFILKVFAVAAAVAAALAALSWFDKAAITHMRGLNQYTARIRKAIGLTQ